MAPTMVPSYPYRTLYDPTKDDLQSKPAGVRAEAIEKTEGLSNQIIEHAIAMFNTRGWREGAAARGLVLTDEYTTSSHPFSIAIGEYVEKWGQSAAQEAARGYQAILVFDQGTNAQGIAVQEVVVKGDVVPTASDDDAKKAFESLLFKTGYMLGILRNMG